MIKAWIANNAVSLKGVRVLVTRTASESEIFGLMLHSHDAIPVLFPVIEIRAIGKPIRSDAVLSADTVIFTSANGVHYGLLACQVAGLLHSVLQSKRIAAVGAKTAAVLGEYGLAADLIPVSGDSTGLIDLLRDNGLGNSSIAVFRGMETAYDYEAALMSYGARVESLIVYQTVHRMPTPEQFTALQSGVDAVTLFSGSAVEGLQFALGDQYLTVMQRIATVCIGEYTARVLYESGVTPTIIASRPSSEGVIEALRRLFTDG